MNRQVGILALMTALVLGASSSILAQVGAPPRRTPPNQPFGVPPNNRVPPPGPSAEDILKLLFPPQEFDPDFEPEEDDPPPRRPRVPTSQEVAQLSSYQQRALLRKAVQSLDEDFDRIKTGAGWKKYLNTEQLGSSLWCSKSLPPEADTRAVLAEIASRFDAVARDPKYKTVPRLWGFQTVHSALGEYAMSPVDKSKREVRSASGRLLSSLDSMSTADAWKKYLDTSALGKLTLADSSLEDEELLRKILGQFKKVAENPKYRDVARKRGFQETYSGLEKLSKNVMQSKRLNTASKAKQALESMTANMRSAHKKSREMMETRQALNGQDPQSDKSRKTRQLLEAIKQSQASAQKRSRDDIDRVKKMISQAIRNDQAKKKRRDPAGTVRLIETDQDDADKKQMMAKLIRHMKSIKKSRQDMSEAKAAMSTVKLGSPDAEAAKKKLAVYQQQRKQANSLSQEQIEKLKKFIAQAAKQNKKPSRDPKGTLKLSPRDKEPEYILMQFEEEEDGDTDTVTLLQFEDNPDPCKKDKYTLVQLFVPEEPNESATVTLMQFEDTAESEPEEVMLLQFQEEPENEEEVEYVLLQFDDVQDSDDESDEKSASKDDKKSK